MENKKYNSTRECLLDMVEEHLRDNPSVSAEGFGWRATGDTTLVKRLREGKDITTRKLDIILKYLHKNKKRTEL